MDELKRIIRNRIKETKAGPQRGDRDVNVTGYSKEYVAGRIYEAKMILQEISRLTKQTTSDEKGVRVYPHSPTVGKMCPHSE